MSFVHDFDEVVDRRGTDSKKYSQYPADVLPMWIADSDFKAPKPVVDALVERMQQGVYGYTPISSRLRAAAAKWQTERFGWNVDESWVEFGSRGNFRRDQRGKGTEPSGGQYCDPDALLSAVYRFV